MQALFENTRSYVLGDPELEIIGDRNKLAQIVTSAWGRPSISSVARLSTAVETSMRGPNSTALIQKTGAHNGPTLANARNQSQHELSGGRTGPCGESFSANRSRVAQVRHGKCGWRAPDFNHGLSGARLSGRAQEKRQSALGQFYCFRCKAPKEALGGMADFIPTSDSGGRLQALCADCECACNRNVSTSDLPEVRTVLDIEIRSSKRA